MRTVAPTLLVVLSAACGGAAARPAAAPDGEVAPAGPPTRAPLARPLLVPGEQMEWHVSLRGVTGGEALLVVGEPGELDGRQVIAVRSEVRSAGVMEMIKKVRDDVTTWVDLETSLPVRSRSDVELGDRAALIEAVFGAARCDVTLRRRGQAAHRTVQRLPAGEQAHEFHSLLGLLRAWTPAPGTRAEILGLSGRRVWRLELAFKGAGELETGLGHYPVVRIDGVATRLTPSLQLDRRRKPRTFSMWLSDDADRLPLLVTAHTEYGDLRIELTGYQRPDQPVSLATP